MTHSPLDPESQFSELLAQYDEVLATASDTLAVSSQPFACNLVDADLQHRFDRAQACLQLLDQDRRRQIASSVQVDDTNDEHGGQSQRAGKPASVPRQIGRFRVIQRLGSGGFGVVFLAEDPVLRRLVAIKMPLATIFQSQELHARFLRECRAAAKLDHPGIVRVLESGDVQGIPYQVAEFVNGERLSDLIKRQRLSVRSSAGIVRNLADAVQHAHDHGVLHRDIKPDNILMQPLPDSPWEENAENTPTDQATIQTMRQTDPVPRITDFGLARVADDDTALSRSGMLVGTPKYMSPEQLRGSLRLQGPQSDIYSLGVVLHELLTGAVPFSDVGSLPSRIAISENSVPSFRSGKSGISRDLESICLKCLHLRPADRYASAGELRDDLARFMDGRPTLARPIPAHEQFLRWVGGNRKLAAMLGMVVLSVLIVTVQAIRNDRSSREQNTTLSSTLAQLTSEKLRADESLKLANSNRIAAEESESNAREIAWQAQQGEYSTRLIQGSAFWKSGEIASMNEVLLPFLPSGKSELRGFEWRYLWNQGQTLRPLIGHTAAVQGLTIADNAEHGYSIGGDNTIRRWHLRSGVLESNWKLDGEGDYVRATISKSSLRAVISRKIQRRQMDDVTVWDLQTGKTLMRREFALHEVGAVAISDDGRTVVIGGRHKPAENQYLPFAQVWIPDSGRVIRDESTFVNVTVGDTHVPGHTISAITFISDRNEILVATQAGFGREDWLHELLHVSLDLGSLDAPRKSTAVFSVLSPIKSERGIVSHLCCSVDGRHLALIVGHELNVGGELIVGGGQYSVEIWDLKKRELVRSTDASVGKIDCIAFDATGTQLGLGLIVPGVTPEEKPAGPGNRITTSSRSEFRLWDFSGDTIQTLPYPAIRDVTFLKPLDSGGGWIVGEGGGALNLWQPDAVAPFRELHGHRPSEAWDLAFSMDGSTIFSVGDDHCLRSWDVTSGAEKKFGISRSLLVSCVATSLDGRWAAAGGYDDQIVVYDTESLSVVATLKGHPHDVRAVAFSPDGRFLATGGRDKIIRLWNIPGFDLAGIREGHENTVRALNWTNDGRLCSSDSDGRIVVWDSDGRVVRERFEKEGVHCLAFAPAGLRIPVPATGSAAGGPDSSSQMATASNTNPGILTLQSDELLALGMNHGAVRLWHLPTDTVVFETQHHGVEIRSLAFSPDGGTLAVAGSDEAVYLWHVVTGRNVLTFDQLGAPVNRVIFSPDGSLLLAALHDGTIRMWHAPHLSSR